MFSPLDVLRKDACKIMAQLHTSFFTHVEGCTGSRFSAIAVSDGSSSDLQPDAPKDGEKRKPKRKTTLKKRTRNQGDNRGATRAEAEQDERIELSNALEPECVETEVLTAVESLIETPDLIRVCFQQD